MPNQKAQTVEAAKALVGTRWRRDGKEREVTRVTDLKRMATGTIYGNVYWRRPGGKERKQSQWLPYFESWRSKAKQVIEKADNV